MILRLAALWLAILISTGHCQVPFGFRRPTQFPIQGVGDVINVLDFGAQCNGSTDDTVAIQNAIDEAARVGQGTATVYVPRGTGLCKLSFGAKWAIALKDRVRLVCEAGAGFLIDTASATSTCNSSPQRAAIAVGNDTGGTFTRQGVYGCVLDGNEPVATVFNEFCNGIVSAPGSGGTVSNLEIVGNDITGFHGDAIGMCGRAGSGLSTGTTDGVDAHDNYIHSILGQAFGFGGTSQGGLTCFIKNMRIHHNRMYLSSSAASGGSEAIIASNGWSNLIVDHNQITGWGCTSYTGTGPLTVTDNQFDSVGNTGGLCQAVINVLSTADVAVANPDRVTITGNLIDAESGMATTVGVSGIGLVGNVDNFVVAHNVIRRQATSTTGRGITISLGTSGLGRGVIDSNVVYNGDGSGSDSGDFLAFQPTSVLARQLTITNNQFLSTGQTCIEVFGAPTGVTTAYAVIKGNTCTSGCINLENAPESIISDNKVTMTTSGQCGGSAISLGGDPRTSVIGNILNVNRSSSDGIRMRVRFSTGTTNSIVASNIITLAGGGTQIHLREVTAELADSNTYADNLLRGTTAKVTIIGASSVFRDRSNALTYSLMNAIAGGNGSDVYCSDCVIANPCAASGLGAPARKLNGSWQCSEATTTSTSTSTSSTTSTSTSTSTTTST